MASEMTELAGDPTAVRGFGDAGSAALPRALPPTAVLNLRAHEGRYGRPGLRGTALIAEVERSG